MKVFVQNSLPSYWKAQRNWVFMEKGKLSVKWNSNNWSWMHTRDWPISCLAWLQIRILSCPLAIQVMLFTWQDNLRHLGCEIVAKLTTKLLDAESRLCCPRKDYNTFVPDFFSIFEWITEAWKDLKSSLFAALHEIKSDRFSQVCGQTLTFVGQ